MGKRVYEYGGSMHRIKKVPARGARIQLPPEHGALTEGRTLFPSRVVHASMSPRILVSGMNSRKTGKKVTKGKWKGMPIYTLTLEELSTCPASCQQWKTCYGNNMHMARRIMHDATFERRLGDEIASLSKQHRAGFVVRLHVLGDFYSVDYVNLWSGWLAKFPALHVFGYTARDPDSDIGHAVECLSFDYPERCRVRLSGTDADGLGALVIDRREDSKHVLCPAQTDATDCCGTCGVCWSSDRVVEFLRH